VEYTNAKTFPRITITLLEATSYGSWRLDTSISQCNLIAIVGSKTLNPSAEPIEERYGQYIVLLKKIADLLNWELVEEKTEAGLVPTLC
jgi:hypothetical protein